VLGDTASLLFLFNASAGRAMTLESRVRMTVTPDTMAPQRIMLRLNEASATGDGVVLGSADLCAASIRAGVCQGESASIVALRSAAVEAPAASAGLGAALRYDLLHDIVIDAGTTGSASLASSQLTFTPIPEPATWVNLVAGLAALLAVRRRLKQ
jgi:hypothetical protein